MARQTRQQRRERREAQGDSGDQRGSAPARLRPLAAPAAGGEAPTTAKGGWGPIRFLRESWAELQKVEWPGQQQLIQGTLVVLIACIVVGFYLWVNDKVWQYVVQHILLG